MTALALALIAIAAAADEGPLLGFTPEIDFQSGAADTARWYRSRGLLAPRAANEVAGRVESA